MKKNDILCSLKVKRRGKEIGFDVYTTESFGINVCIIT